MAPLPTEAISPSAIATGKTMTNEKAATKDKSSSTDSATTTSKTESKTESSTSSSGAPANYSRGEGQKPVSSAYRENWNLIFGNETTTRKTAKASGKTKSAKATAKKKTVKKKTANAKTATNKTGPKKAKTKTKKR
jgi:hypothetical protein